MIIEIFDFFKNVLFSLSFHSAENNRIYFLVRSPYTFKPPYPHLCPNCAETEKWLEEYIKQNSKLGMIIFVCSSDKVSHTILYIKSYNI